MRAEQSGWQHRTKAAAALIAAVALLPGACVKPAPQGQVLADVDGEDITRRDLAFELQSPEGRGVAPAVLLDRLIDRRLLARAARAEGIEQSSAYLGQVRRQRELLLAQLYVDRLARAAPAPSAAAVAAYIERHPEAFAARRLVDAVRLTTSARPAARAIARDAATLDQAATLLARAGETARLEPVTFDSATVPPATFAALAGGARRVFTDAADRTEAIAPLRVRAAPRLGAAAAAEARRALTEAAVAARLAARLQSARAGALVRRQAGTGVAPMVERGTI